LTCRRVASASPAAPSLRADRALRINYHTGDANFAMSSLLTYTIAGRTLRTLVNGVCLAAALFAGPSLAEAAESEPVPVGERMRALLERDWLERDLAFAASTASKTPSPGMNASGVTTAQDASGGCDGIKNGKWGFHTASGERDPWWQVDLGTTFKLDRVVIFNRTDLGTAPRTRNIRILVCNVDGTPRDFHLVYQHSGDVFYGVEKNAPLVVNFRDKNVRARIVRLQIPGRCSFALDEVEVYSTDDPERNVALGRPADQKSVGPHSFRGTMGEVSRVNRTMMDSGGGFMLAHTKEVVQRGKELARRLSRKSPPDRFQSLLTNLQQLEQRLADMEKSGEADEVVRRRIYFEARSLVREIAFCNPLLDFDRLLFIKRRKPGGVFHMCDQYYGFNAVPGGGLFMLADPFGPNPKLVDLLSHSVVERGRLAGRKLNEGSFLSPELSFDGKTILFAYSEASGRDLEWSPTSCYHVFRVNADGTGLVQLTDGP